MASDRVTRLVERLLDQADKASESGNWEEVAQVCHRVLAVEPDNPDAVAMLQMAGIDEITSESLAESPVLGERRIVTVLFADAVGFTPMSESLDEEDVYRTIQRCVAVMSGAVERHGGLVTQFRGDGIMALFGAPIAQERAEVAGVAAALEIQAELVEVADELEASIGVRPEFRVGLNSGGVVVGSISEDLSMDFTALGDTVNLAARMEQIAAPGAVFLTERTHRAVAGFIECEDLGERVVKGKSGGVRTYRALRMLDVADRLEAEASRGLSTFVGRELELGLLRGLVDRATPGRSQGVLLTGEAGIGKSRLLLELRSSLPLADVRWLRGQCSLERQSSPFHAIAEMVRGALEGDDQPVVSEEHRPFIDLLLRGEDEVTAGLDLADRNAGIVDAAVAVIGALAERVTVVAAIEDAHWADEATTSMIVPLMKRLSDKALVVIVTSRPGYDNPLSGQAGISHLVLDSLGDSEVVELVSAQVGELMNSSIIEACARSEGNPFFAEELVRSLIETGSRGEADEVPDSVHEVILTRIDRLPVSARRTLQFASVVGRQATRALLEGMTDEDDLQEELEVLASADLLLPSVFDPDHVVEFRHALTQEVAYSTLLHESRRELHGAVATQMLELADGDSTGIESVLAYHYERSAQWSIASTFLRAAADRASDTGAVNSAIDLLSRSVEAAERCDDSEQLVLSSRQLAGVGMATGRFDVASAEWSRLEDLAKTNNDLGLQVTAHAQLGVVAMFDHDESGADEFTATAVNIASTSTEPDAYATALGARLWFAIVSGRHEEVEALRRSFETVEVSASLEAQELWQGNESMLSRWGGSFDDVIRLTDQDARTIREGGRIGVLSRQAWIRSMALTEAGRYEEALALCTQVVDKSEQVVSLLWWARLLNTTGWLLREMLDPVAAIGWNERSLKAAHDFPAPDVEIECNARLNLIEDYLMLGRNEEASSYIDSVRAVIEDPGPRDWFMMWRFSQRYLEIDGRLALIAGDPKRALELADSCLVAAAKSRSRKNLAKGHRLRSRALLAMGDPIGAAEAAGSSLSEAQALAGPGQLWRTYLAAAEISDVTGDDFNADAMREAARSVLDQLASDLSAERRATFLSSSIYAQTAS